MKHKIYVNREKPGLGYEKAYLTVRRAVRAALEAEKIEEPCTVCVLFTDDGGIREINREQREIDAATDVLSFPMNELEEGRPDFECAERCEDGSVFLGDMVVSLERADRQGEEYGHGFEHELSYLAVHSVMHLLGYDHLDEGPRKRRMRAREKAAMALLGME
ncbi:MAG: rRNA maturation RNase YbeY [Oscillospiraceae bacterium]|nr:rRNA maturation RNase YbeY [Oscillospiraceae bacterium]